MPTLETVVLARSQALAAREAALAQLATWAGVAPPHQYDPAKLGTPLDETNTQVAVAFLAERVAQLAALAGPVTLTTAARATEGEPAEATPEADAAAATPAKKAKTRKAE